MRTPDHRARRILELAATRSEFDEVDPLERDFFYLVKTGESTLDAVREAYDIYADPEFRHVFDALLIGHAEDALVADALRCDPTVLVPYRHLFCDVRVFRHTPAVLRYVQQLDLDDEDPVQSVRREYYTVAATQGPEYLANRFRVGARPDVEPRRVIKTSVADMHDRFLAHRGQQLTSEIAREALRWGNSAVSAAVVLIDKGGDTRKDAIADLRVALEMNDLTQTAEESGIDLTKVLS